MKSFLACFAALVISLSFASSTRAQSSLEDNQAYYNFKSSVRNTQDPKPLPMLFHWCRNSYDKLIATGVSPSTRVREEYIDTYDGLKIHWTGTLKEIKEKYCDAPEKKVEADWIAKQAPYKAVLKADKLRLVINENSRVVYEYALAGGKYTGDAEALAAANVWFLNVGAATNERRVCVNGGKLSSVRRYSFDANHKLLGTTEKEYCGTPPASAYR